MERYAKGVIVLLVILLLLLPLDTLGRGEDFYKVTYSEGLTVIVEKLPNVEGVALIAMVRVGGLDHPEERVSQEAQSLLVDLLLKEECHPTVSEDLSRLYQEVGGGVSALAREGVAEFSVVTLQKNWRPGVELLSLLLTQPRIRESDLEQVRQERIEQVEEAPWVERVRQLLEDKLLGRRGGGFSQREKEEVLKQVTPEYLQQIYQQYYCLRNIIVVAVGNLDPPFTAEYIAESFKKKIPRSPRLLREPLRRGRRDYSEGLEPGEVPLNPGRETKVTIVEEETPSAVLAIGFKVPGMESPDYSALLVLNALIGGGKGSRLFRYLREKEGIGYEIGGWLPPRLKEGVLMFYVVTQPYRINLRGEREPFLEKALQIMEGQIEAVTRGDFSEAELVRARQYLKGSWLIRRERLSGRASLTGWWALASIREAHPEDFLRRIEAVSRKQLLAVAKKYMRSPFIALILPRQGGPTDSRGVSSRRTTGVSRESKSFHHLYYPVWKRNKG